jgi:hypothetical protein
MELDEEEEGATKLLFEAQIAKTNRVWGGCFWHVPIDIDEDMEDVKEIDGTSIQLETSRQLKISPTLLLALKSWNLGQLQPQNPILLLGKRILVEQSLHYYQSGV